MTSLKKECDALVSLLHQHTSGSRLIRTTAAINRTDRWVSFDKFKQTSAYLQKEYAKAGAKVNVYPIPTGGQVGNGRWVVAEAQDIRSGTLDLITPVKERLLDYHKNPFHVGTWSMGTPPEGIEGEIIVLNSRKEIESCSRDRLNGNFVLTRVEFPGLYRVLTSKGARALLNDKPVYGMPDAVRWVALGWGSVSLTERPVPLTRLSLSGNQGEYVRKLAKQQARMRARITADIHTYMGSHDLVSGVIRGTEYADQELWILAHSSEPGAADNASGVAATVEIARVIEKLIGRGDLERPKRTIRLLNGYECYSFFHYLEHRSSTNRLVGGLVIDTIGQAAEVNGGRLQWHATIPMSAQFVNPIGKAMLQSALRIDSAGYRLYDRPFVETNDTDIGDPKFGFPCPWVTTYFRTPTQSYHSYHSSGDTTDELSPDGMRTITAAIAGYIYYLANIDTTQLKACAQRETNRIKGQLKKVKGKSSGIQKTYLLEQHQSSMKQLSKWLYPTPGTELAKVTSACADEVRELAGKKSHQPAVHKDAATRIPARGVPVVPMHDNIEKDLSNRIKECRLPSWALYWANGLRTLNEIRDRISIELGKDIAIKRVIDYFDAHEELRYVNYEIRKSDLVKAFRDLGLKAGDRVIVHSAMSRLGHVVGGATTVIQTLQEVLTTKGTLMMPSFNHGVIFRPGEAGYFDPTETKTENGTIPETFWRMPKVYRSWHPTHSFAVWGHKAHDYTRHHHRVRTMGAGSPLDMLHTDGGYGLLLGVDYQANTFHHVVETLLESPCNGIRTSEHPVKLPNGKMVAARSWGWRAGKCPINDSARYGKEMEVRGLETKCRIGNADVTLFRLSDCHDVVEHALKNGLDEYPPCHQCKIRPEISDHTVESDWDSRCNRLKKNSSSWGF